jgi:hypothetical protein
MANQKRKASRSPSRNSRTSVKRRRLVVKKAKSPRRSPKKSPQRKSSNVSFNFTPLSPRSSPRRSNSLSYSPFM